MKTKQPLKQIGNLAPQPLQGKPRTSTARTRLIPVPPQADNKLFRILRHLGTDIAREHPNLKRPSNYLLKQLTFNYVTHQYRRWCPEVELELKYIIEECLQFLLAQCCTSRPGLRLTHRESDTPLFPNQESFSREDAIAYFKTAIQSYREAIDHSR